MGSGEWELELRMGMGNEEWEIFVVLFQCKYLDRNGEWEGEWRMGMGIENGE